MQFTLWGEPEPTPTAREKTSTSLSITVTHTAQDCLIYGHDWQLFGFYGVKRCEACHLIGYCPLCATTPPENAQPFYCSRHSESTTVSV